MSMIDEIKRLSEDVASQHKHIHSEDETKRVSVIPFIEALGFNTRTLADVRSEYVADARDKGGYKVDYVIFKESEPIFAIEVKGAYLSLTEDNWDQLRDYYADLDVKFGILTNGKEYRFYTDLRKLNIMDKEPFLTIDLLNLNPRLLVELNGFTKANFDPDAILSSARKLMVRKLLKREIAQPSDHLVRYFAQQVHRNQLKSADIKGFGPAVRLAWREIIDDEIAKRVTVPDTGEQANKDAVTDSSHPKETSSASNPDFTTFLERTSFLEKYSLDGSIEVPVFAEFKGHSFKAKLSLYGKLHNAAAIIQFNGKWLTPLEAGKRTRMTVDPTATYYVNGMTYWRLYDPASGVDRPINDLRYDEELLQRVLDNA